jgi:hypothetical protein
MGYCFSKEAREDWSGIVSSHRDLWKLINPKGRHVYCSLLAFILGVAAFDLLVVLVVIPLSLVLALVWRLGGFGKFMAKVRRENLEERVAAGSVEH